MAEACKVDDECLASLSGQAFRRAIAHHADGISLRVKPLMRVHPALRHRVLRTALVSAGVDVGRLGATQWKALESLLRREKGEISLAEGFVARRVEERLVVCKGAKCARPARSYRRVVKAPGRTVLSEAGLVLETRLVRRTGRFSEASLRRAGPLSACFDWDLLKEPLRVRNWRAGDRFRPFGMAGHKKIKDFFIDAKVPQDVRRRVPLLLSDDKVIWIVGWRRSAAAPIGSRTRRVLVVKASSK